MTTAGLVYHLTSFSAGAADSCVDSWNVTQPLDFAALDHLFLKE